MHRGKSVEYDDDDLYSDDGEDGYGGDEQGYTAEDKENFATLTPVVRAELEEVGVQATNKEIEDALWHYYWDVSKSVTYLKNSKGPRPAAPKATPKKDKAKSKFDEAAEKSAKGERRLSFCDVSFASRPVPADGGEYGAPVDRTTVCTPPPTSLDRSMRGAQKSGLDWFRGTPWTNVPDHLVGQLVPAASRRPEPKLLGGSSKLAKLAEERRKKAAAAAAASTATGTNTTSSGEQAQSASSTTLSSLDRLSRAKNSDGVATSMLKGEPRRYPIRKKKEPSPPPREPTPPPAEAIEEDLPDLRASPTHFACTLSTSPSQALHLSKMSLGEVFQQDTSTNPFDKPSPDDVVLHAQQGSKEPVKPKANKSSLEQKTSALKIDGDNAPSTPSQPKVRGKGLDVPKLWAEAGSSRKPSAAFVVVGHVDHGKSTLMGRLLLDTGAVAQRDIDKFKKQATELGKASFALAWVMDTGSEERERGVTVDIAQHHFSTEKADLTILDAPGHRDFVPNMVAGAFMADMAVLVVDATQLDSGMKGQTREHILLVKAVGITRIVVAVNKMDATNPPWDQTIFTSVSETLVKFLKDVGFPEENIIVTPCSGLKGENVAKSIEKGSNVTWIASSHRTLLQAIEASMPPGPPLETIKQPLRLQISDVFRGGITNPLSIAGPVLRGNVQVGDVVLVQPSGETASIRGIDVGGEQREYAVAGQLCNLHLSDIEPKYLRIGDLVCSTSQAVPVSKSFTVRVEALETLLPQAVDVHIGRLHVPGQITQLIAILDAASGEVSKKKPRVVKQGQTAVVRIALEHGTAVPDQSRVILRSAGNTVASGTVDSLQQ